MLLRKESVGNACIIGIWEVEESLSELLSLLQNATFYTEQLSQLTSEKRQKEWLAARILTNQLCGSEKIISYKENGKPFLSDNSFQISISHSKNNIAVIIHPEKEVGIDIEQIHDRIIALQNKFLSDAEAKHIDKQDERNHLLLHWCAKEVLYKMMDKEEVDFSEHLHISAFKPEEKEGRFLGQETKSKKKENYLFEYKIEKDFILVWSVK